MDAMRKYRNNGAIGAILDEYQKALDELIAVIRRLTAEELTTVVDANTKDEDCRSIQTILSHIVQSGYTYVVEIRKWLGEEVEYREKELYTSVDEYERALQEMFLYNEALFVDHPNIVFEQDDYNKKIHVRWGQYYDVEQLYEHAIVHILRHRRQIEKFKIGLKINKNSNND